MHVKHNTFLMYIDLIEMQCTRTVTLAYFGVIALLMSKLPSDA